jgi:hypothetical protein
MENSINYLKINEQCLRNIKDVSDALGAIETKGDSTMIMFRIRTTLMATLEQIQKDNTEEKKEEKGIIIDNTKGKEGM